MVKCYILFVVAGPHTKFHMPSVNVAVSLMTRSLQKSCEKKLFTMNGRGDIGEYLCEVALQLCRNFGWGKSPKAQNWEKLLI